MSTPLQASLPYQSASTPPTPGFFFFFFCTVKTSLLNKENKPTDRKTCLLMRVSSLNRNQWQTHQLNYCKALWYISDFNIGICALKYQEEKRSTGLRKQALKTTQACIRKSHTLHLSRCFTLEDTERGELASEWQTFFSTSGQHRLFIHSQRELSSECLLSLLFVRNKHKLLYCAVNT